MGLEDDRHVLQLIELARSEDLGAGDVTSSLLPDATRRASFQLIAKQEGIFVGAEVATLVLRAYDPSIVLTWRPGVRDGEAIRGIPAELATLEGPLVYVLSAERVLLNFLQRLCGIASLTRRFVDAVSGTAAAIYDTRKTTPGWRPLERYAVRCGGGGCNHRAGLYDAVLIKDNHLFNVSTPRLAGTVFEMLNVLGARRDELSFVCVEARSLEQVEELFKVVGIDVILLDNFGVELLRRAVRLRNQNGLSGKVLLEASGGIRLDNVRAVAETGVDRISIGALTHSATAWTWP